MARVLISGGTGFVGRAVVEAFLQAGDEVAVLNRGTYALAGVRQLTADRNDGAAVAGLLAGERFDQVIDTNGYTPAQAAILADAVEGRAGRLVMISSAAVYSDNALQPPGENQPAMGAGVWGDYGRDKALAEDVYRARQGRFDAVTFVRPPYIFGPGNNLDRERWFWARQYLGLPTILPDLDLTQVHFIHVDDLANAIRMLARRDDGGCLAINAASPEQLSFGELAALLAKVIDRPADIRVAQTASPARSWFPFRAYPCLADSTLLLERYGWRPGATLRDQLAQTAEVLGRRAIVEGFKSTPVEAEIAKDLGLAWP